MASVVIPWAASAGARQSVTSVAFAAVRGTLSRVLSSFDFRACETCGVLLPHALTPSSVAPHASAERDRRGKPSRDVMTVLLLWGKGWVVWQPSELNDTLTGGCRFGAFERSDAFFFTVSQILIEQGVSDAQRGRQ